MATWFRLVQGLAVAVLLARPLLWLGHRTRAAPRATQARAAPCAFAYFALHTVGLAMVIGAATVRPPPVEPGPRTAAGLALLSLAVLLLAWVLRVFTHYRLMSEVSVGHALCVDGPFRLVRHPTYLVMALWALGTALVCPGPWALAGLAVILVANELRARAEERLLEQVFGEPYRAYLHQVRGRFVPGLW